MWGSEELVPPAAGLAQLGHRRPCLQGPLFSVSFPEHSEGQPRGTGFVFKEVFMLWGMKLALVLGQGLREALRGEKMMLLLLPSFPLFLTL